MRILFWAFHWAQFLSRFLPLLFLALNEPFFTRLARMQQYLIHIFLTLTWIDPLRHESFMFNYEISQRAKFRCLPISFDGPLLIEIFSVRKWIFPDARRIFKSLWGVWSLSVILQQPSSCKPKTFDVVYPTIDFIIRRLVGQVYFRALRIRRQAIDLFGVFLARVFGVLLAWTISGKNSWRFEVFDSWPETF